MCGLTPPPEMPQLAKSWANSSSFLTDSCMCLGTILCFPASKHVWVQTSNISEVRYSSVAAMATAADLPTLAEVLCPLIYLRVLPTGKTSPALDDPVLYFPPFLAPFAPLVGISLILKFINYLFHNL